MAQGKTKHLIWVVLLDALTSGALAQLKPKSTARHPAETSAQMGSKSTLYRLLTADEGLAIIGAALETRHNPQSNQDCSHLVHTIYEKAGFSYRYADSSQLYEGVEDFRQVTHPQPGDLAVWRGHAAIVINPAQHSFFSSMTSGLRIDSYDSDYWKRRGPPRFFRYVKPGRIPSLRNVESRSPLAPATDFDDPLIDDPLTSALPLVLVVHASQPKTKHLDEALSLYFGATEKALRDQDLLRLLRPIVVINKVEFQGAHFKGNQGWVSVKVAGVFSLLAGRASAKKISDHQRWLLNRRDANTWELLLPARTIYLPHGAAVRILADQLASLADNESGTGDSSKDQAQLARTLNLLLEK
jgi:hypothetical protein